MVFSPTFSHRAVSSGCKTTKNDLFRAIIFHKKLSTDILLLQKWRFLSKMSAFASFYCCYFLFTEKYRLKRFSFPNFEAMRRAKYENLFSASNS
jgi:hypothetical protein